jgi:hypothetical protein
MTTTLDTIMKVLPSLSEEQLVVVEKYVVGYCRQNIINNINSLPNSSLSRVDSYLKQAVQKPQTTPPCNCGGVHNHGCHVYRAQVYGKHL